MRATSEVQVPASLSQNLDFLSALEEQEDADKARKEGPRKVEEESFGIGFKSGFLGGGGSARPLRRSPPQISQRQYQPVWRSARWPLGEWC